MADILPEAQQGWFDRLLHWPDTPLRERRRWTDEELDEFKQALILAGMSPVADAIGSLQFDKVDLKRLGEGRQKVERSSATPRGTHMKPVALVLAGTMQEYRHFIQQHGLDPQAWPAVTRAEQACGFDHPKYVLVGTFPRLRDWVDILDCLRAADGTEVALELRRL